MSDSGVGSCEAKHFLTIRPGKLMVGHRTQCSYATGCMSLEHCVKINMACSGTDSSQALSQQPRRLFPPEEVNYYCIQVNVFLDGSCRRLCFIRCRLDVQAKMYILADQHAKGLLAPAGYNIVNVALKSSPYKPT